MSGLKQILTDYCARHSLRFQLNTVQSQSGSEWQALATVSDFLREVHFESSAATQQAATDATLGALATSLTSGDGARWKYDKILQTSDSGEPTQLNVSFVTGLPDSSLHTAKATLIQGSNKHEAQASASTKTQAQHLALRSLVEDALKHTLFSSRPELLEAPPPMPLLVPPSWMVLAYVAQQLKVDPPVFAYNKEKGTPPTWTATVKILSGDDAMTAKGSGSNRKAAQEEACQHLLSQMQPTKLSFKQT